jgi:hypothetical protein
MTNSHKKDALELVSILFFIFSFSFLLNFLWEALHAVYLYERHDFNASNYVPMLIYVSFVDGLLIDGLYIATGLVWRKILWIKELSYLQKFFFAAGGILTAGFVEYRSVYIADRWVYKVDMPTILGIGLSPLVQLSFTGLLSLWLAKEILYGRGFLGK